MFSVCGIFLAERLAHPRRELKPEFKLERYPPLDGGLHYLVLSESWISTFLGR